MWPKVICSTWGPKEEKEGGIFEKPLRMKYPGTAATEGRDLIDKRGAGWDIGQV